MSCVFQALLEAVACVSCTDCGAHFRVRNNDDVSAKLKVRNYFSITKIEMNRKLQLVKELETKIREEDNKCCYKNYMFLMTSGQLLVKWSCIVYQKASLCSVYNIFLI